MAGKLKNYEKLSKYFSLSISILGIGAHCIVSHFRVSVKSLFHGSCELFFSGRYLGISPDPLFHCNNFYKCSTFPCDGKAFPFYEGM